MTSSEDVRSSIVAMLQAPPPSESAIARPTRRPAGHESYRVNVCSWLLRELNDNDFACFTVSYPNPAFVPSIDQIERLPKKIGDICLTTPQMAIVLANAFSPTRAVSLKHPNRGPFENVLDVDVGARATVRLLFAPTGTGKTIMAMLSGLMMVREHYQAYAANDLWRADTFGCVSSTTPIAPLMFCVISPILFSQWCATARSCASAFGGPGIDVFPKRDYDNNDLSKLLSAIEIARATGGMVLYLITSDLAHVFFTKLSEHFLPTVFMMEEVAHDACSVKFACMPFTLLITASRGRIFNSLTGKRYDSLIRTIFDEERTGTLVSSRARIAACDVARPYYRALVLRAAEQMPEEFVHIGVRIERRGSYLGSLVHTDLDPTLSVSLPQLCQWLAMPFNPENPPELLDLLNKKPANCISTALANNYRLMHTRLDATKIECIACMREVLLKGSSAAAKARLSAEDFESEYIDSGSVLLTGCCCTVLCLDCCGRMARKNCPQCAIPLTHPKAHHVEVNPSAAISTVCDMPQTQTQLVDFLRAMPVQKCTTFSAINTILHAMHSAGTRRVLLSWSLGPFALKLIESNTRTLFPLGLMEPHAPASQRGGGKKRRLADENTLQFFNAQSETVGMSVLVVNSRTHGCGQVVAGLDLPSIEAIILMGKHDHHQIMARAIRMGPVRTANKIVVEVLDEN